MTESITVVMCGTLKNEAVVLNALEPFVRLRNAGIVKRIVLSTWLSQGAMIERLRPLLVANNIEILISEDIEYPKIHGHAFEQMLTLDAALDNIDTSDIVFRTRIASQDVV